jgi:hypothetical protein
MNGPYRVTTKKAEPVAARLIKQSIGGSQGGVFKPKVDDSAGRLGAPRRDPMKW